jgi:pimeloyl-ACP methyl ester carboxylesterase
MAHQQSTTPVRTGYAAANGISYYYEIHGHGAPLLLLHGGFGSTGMFEPDIVLGYSMGGGVALRLAIQHPDVVRRLVLVSTPYAQSGFFPELLPQQAALGASMLPMMKQTPMYASYVAVAPRPEDFPRLLDRMGEWMREPYDWSDDVRTLKGPVMLVYGDADMFDPEHIVRFYRLLGGGLKDAGWQREHMSPNRLAILPNVTHYEMWASPALVPAVLPFLDGVTGAPGAGGR